MFFFLDSRQFNNVHYEYQVDWLQCAKHYKGLKMLYLIGPDGLVNLSFENFQKNATWRWQWANLKICQYDMHP